MHGSPISHLGLSTRLQGWLDWEMVVTPCALWTSGELNPGILGFSPILWPLHPINCMPWLISFRPVAVVWHRNKHHWAKFFTCFTWFPWEHSRRQLYVSIPPTWRGLKMHSFMESNKCKTCAILHLVKAKKKEQKLTLRKTQGKWNKGPCDCGLKTIIGQIWIVVRMPGSTISAIPSRLAFHANILVILSKGQARPQLFLRKFWRIQGAYSMASRW